MNYPNHLQYSKSHEWVEKLGGNMVRIGLTDFAQSELGDIVFVNLPNVGDTLVLEESFADVESVKAVSDIYSPVSGEVTDVNGDLEDEPERINDDCYDAWLIEAECNVLPDDLLTAQEYDAFTQEEE